MRDREGFSVSLFFMSSVRYYFQVIEPFSTTGIGSLPHLVADEACRLVLKTFDIPFWPQLPRLSFLEWMIPQYTEGMPFIHIDLKKETMFISRNESDELERFYETCNDDCRIAISEDYAKGLHVFLKVIRSRQFKFLKGQITGPLTFTLGLKDTDGRLVFFDEELRQISLMLLQAKARWQIDILKSYAQDIVIFIDEPILSSVGSSTYLGVSREETLRMLKEMVDTIKQSGAISGIHCCGNADWPLVIESGVDIINFDAYGYFDNIAIYYNDLRGFFERGGYLAWGIVPTTEAIAGENIESLVDNFGNKLRLLAKKIPEDILMSQAILTPSCGTGYRSIQETIKIFQLIMRLKEAFV